MHHFDYSDGVLHAEAVNLSALADAVGTPFYCYSTATLERHYRVFTEAFADTDALVCYAMKANSNQSVLRTLAKLGAGADVVSGGEMARALAAGIPPSKIVFSGVGKTVDELRAALDHDILCINVESEPELEVLSRAGRVDGQDRADLDPGQSGRRFRHACQNLHRQIREQVRHSAGEGPRGLCPCGEAARAPRHRRRRAYRQPDHRSRPDGSRVPDCWPISSPCCAATATPSAMSISAAGSAFPTTKTATAPPEPLAYAAMVKRVTHNLGCRLMFEPGRMIVGNAGILVARVIHVKHGDGKTFVIIDAAMNDLIRPTLYEAYHDILPVKDAGAGRGRDHRRRGRPGMRDRRLSRAVAQLPELKAGDLIAIMTAGAYGAVQAVYLQHPPAGAGSAGEGRSVRRDPPAHQRRATDRDGPAGAVAVSA